MMEYHIIAMALSTIILVIVKYCVIRCYIGIIQSLSLADNPNISTHVQLSRVNKLDRMLRAPYILNAKVECFY